MKKIILLLIIWFFTVGASITFTIDDANLDEFKTGFLKQCPVPVDEEGNPLYTDNQWIKEWGRRAYIGAYKQGKQKIAEEASYSYDGDIVQ